MPTLIELGEMIPEILAKLSTRWAWFPHNMIGHPLSEILFQLGEQEWSNRIHDWTIPAGGATSKTARG